MRNGLRILLIGGTLAALASCSTGGRPGSYNSLYELYAAERARGAVPSDITPARHEEWRGKPITVSQDQIVER